MEMDCIPAGMELFPAADEEQWEFIKKVIDDCDYYLLVIGGRYGSLTDEGISYTEKEFDYAVEKGIKVIALIHETPDDIPSGKSEKDPDLQKKLIAFKDKVKTGRLVRFWKTASDLPGLVALSLGKTIKMYPAVGWVRANHVANEAILTEINQVRKENIELQKTIEKLDSQQQPSIDGIADIDSEFTINGSYFSNSPGSRSSRKYSFFSTISWRELFSLISPYLIEKPNNAAVKSCLASSLLERDGKLGTTRSINDQQFRTVGIQLKAYGLIDMKYVKTVQGGKALFWFLTKKGEQLMLDSRVVKKDTEKNVSEAS